MRRALSCSNTRAYVQLLANPPLSRYAKNRGLFLRNGGWAVRACACAAIVFFCASAIAQAGAPRFLWGAAFSAHQTEGGDRASDWWEWERQPGRIAGGHDTTVATDHYNRYREDFQLAQNLGLGAVRFSVSWSRIEPEEGRFSETELAHYRDVVLDLRARGIEPVVTLHHFSHPRWFHARGGWTDPASPLIFARFAGRVAEALHPYVRIWITFNEPVIQVVAGYLKGEYPPGRRDLADAAAVYGNLVSAHGRAAARIRSLLPPASGLPIHGVGLALHTHAYEPAHDPSTKEGRADLDAISVLSHLYHWAFLEAAQTGRLRLQIPPIPKLPSGLSVDRAIPEAARSLDWVGVNYYSRWLLSREPTYGLGVHWSLPPGGSRWPRGLRQVLRTARRYIRDKIPLVVSENGVDDAADRLRENYVADHLAELAAARGEGIDVRGYWYWSLTDNFEWLKGYGPRFGLVEVDYGAGLRRTVRPSALWFRDFIQHHPEGP